MEIIQCDTVRGVINELLPFLIYRREGTKTTDGNLVVVNQGCVTVVVNEHYTGELQYDYYCVKDRKR